MNQHHSIESVDFTAARDDFRRGYRTAMLWANLADADGTVSNAVADAPDYYDSTLPAEIRDALDRDADDFLADPETLDLLAAATADGAYDYADAGHDFALTRNGHGAGFWDRGLGDTGDRLAEIARPYGERSIMADDSDDPATWSVL